MGSFRTNSRGGFGGRSGGSRFGGGSRDFGGRGGFGDRDSGRFERRTVEMHDATCDKCKKQCQVPFRPSGGKPVFCSNCFKNEGSGSSFGSRDRDRSYSPGASSSGISSDQFKLINVKLDKILSALSTLEIDSDDDSDGDSDDKGEEDSEVEAGSSADSSGDLSADSEKDKDSKDDSEDELDDDSDDDLDDDSDDNSEDEPKAA